MHILMFLVLTIGGGVLAKFGFGVHPYIGGAIGAGVSLVFSFFLSKKGRECCDCCPDWFLGLCEALSDFLCCCELCDLCGDCPDIDCPSLD